MPKHFLTLCCVVLLSLTISACSSTADEDELPASSGMSAEELYEEARLALNAGRLREASDLFEELEREHPFSQWARRGKVMAAYARYKRGDYADAVAMMESYTRLYPAADDAPYAYYIIALSYYEQIADIGRDQKVTEQARKALNDVMRRFPESDYAVDAKLKLDLVHDHLAGKEMEVGRYYQQRDVCMAALNRFRRVVEEYETTTHTPEALHRMVECYLRLGLTDDARRSAAVLGHNYPESAWYADSYRLVTGSTGSDGNLPVPGDDSWLPSLNIF